MCARYEKFLLKTEWRSLAARLQARPRTTSANHRDQHPGMVLPQMSDAGPGQVEKRRSALASGGAAVVWPQITGGYRFRGEPRQCGDRAHRLIAPSMAPTGERRPSMACLRPIPAPPRLSPPQCPWLRRSCLRQVEGKARRSQERHDCEGRRCKGISSERYMDVPRPRVGAGRGTTRRTKSPCSGGPTRSQCCRPCSRGSPRSQRTPALWLWLKPEPRTTTAPAEADELQRFGGIQGREQDRGVDNRPCYTARPLSQARSR